MFHVYIKVWRRIFALAKSGSEGHIDWQISSPKLFRVQISSGRQKLWELGYEKTFESWSFLVKKNNCPGLENFSQNRCLNSFLSSILVRWLKQQRPIAPMAAMDQVLVDKLWSDLAKMAFEKMYGQRKKNWYGWPSLINFFRSNL